MDSKQTRAQAIEEIIICPSCHGSINRDQREYRCSECSAVYPISDEVPILLTPENAEQINTILGCEGQQMVSEYTGPASITSRLKPPSLILPLEPDPTGPELDFLYHNNSPHSIILNVGGGPTRYRTNEITVNLGLFPNVDVVGDAHKLPVESESVDTVICKAVLEHVSNPEQVLKEIDRVLKPGGLVYIDVPFLFITHGYPQDFHRYTWSGTEKILPQYKRIMTGTSIGPFSTHLLLTNDFLLEVLRVRDSILKSAVSGLFRLCFFWIKYFDLLMKCADRKLDYAGAYFFIGKKGE